MSGLQVTVETLSPVVRRLDIKVPAERVASVTEQLFRELGRSAKIKGFRPGHVPRSVLVKHFGDRIGGDVARALVDQTFPEALGTTTLAPVASPVVEPSEVRAGEPFTYSARVEVRPEVTLAPWDGLTVEVDETLVSDADVQRQLEQMRDSIATTVDVTGRDDVQTGDLVAIDYEMKLEGDDRTNRRTDALVRAEAGLFIEGHGEKLVGAKVGETRTFSETYEAGEDTPANLVGKSATVTATVKGLKKRELPALDDDFAKDVGGGETLAELTEKVRAQLEKRAVEATRDARREALLGKLMDLNPFEVPAALVDAAAEQHAQQFLRMIGQAGMKQEMQGSLAERVKQQALPKAALDVRSFFILEAVADAAQIVVGENDVEAKFHEIATEQEVAIEKVRQAYRAERSRLSLLTGIRHDKAYELVASKASFTAKKTA
jgi:trigger factor